MINLRTDNQNNCAHKMHHIHQRTVLAPLLPTLINEHEQHRDHNPHTDSTIHDFRRRREFVDRHGDHDDRKDVKQHQQPRPFAFRHFGISVLHRFLVQCPDEALQSIGKVLSDLLGRIERRPSGSISHSLQPIRQGADHDGKEQLKYRQYHVQLIPIDWLPYPGQSMLLVQLTHRRRNGRQTKDDGVVRRPNRNGVLFGNDDLIQTQHRGHQSDQNGQCEQSRSDDVIAAETSPSLDGRRGLGR
mmetsp:Transcript_11805/g.25651  ORF Transcript_11805/g.25651 Transcript_11805/m.25651 type:complete len:244 (-) Transcript_11805:1796-2527(-)